MELPRAEAKHLFYMEVTQKEDILVKDTDRGELLVSPVSGGFFRGEILNGTVEPAGTGFTWSVPPEKNEIEIKLLLKTLDGGHIFMDSRGTLLIGHDQEELLMKGEQVDPADYYYRFSLSFDTGSSEYRWLNGKCCFAVAGIKDWSTICYDAYMV